MKNILRLVLIIGLISCSDVEKVYDDKGNLISEGRLVEDKKEGVWVNYYTNGDTSAVEHYSAGNLTRKMQYTSDGLSVDESFDQGKKNGAFKVYWPNGSLHIAGTFKSDSLNGKVTNYYLDGTLESEANYENGRPYGVYKYYYQNGAVQVEAENFGNGDHLIYDSLGNFEYTVVLEDFIPIDTLYSKE